MDVKEKREPKIIIDGVLKKWTNYVYRWKSRYCRFTDEGIFYYGKRKTSKLKGKFLIKKTVIKSIPSDPNRMVLSYNGVEIDLRASSLENKTKWLQAFNQYEAKNLEKEEVLSDSSLKGPAPNFLVESDSDQETPLSKGIPTIKRVLDDAKFRNVQVVMQDLKKSSLKQFLKQNSQRSVSPTLKNILETFVILQEKLMNHFECLMGFIHKKTEGINTMQNTLLTINSINILIKNLVSEALAMSGALEESPNKMSSALPLANVPDPEANRCQGNPSAIIEGNEKTPLFEDFNSVDQDSIDSSDADSDKEPPDISENFSSPVAGKGFKFLVKELNDLVKSFKKRQPAKHVNYFRDCFMDFFREQFLLRNNEIFQKIKIENVEGRESLPFLADFKKLDLWGAFKNIAGNKESGGALPGKASSLGLSALV